MTNFFNHTLFMAHKGKPIFERLYQTQSSKFILKFLDERTDFKKIKMFLKTSNHYFFTFVFEF